MRLSLSSTFFQAVFICCRLLTLRVYQKRIGLSTFFFFCRPLRTFWQLAVTVRMMESTRLRHRCQAFSFVRSYRNLSNHQSFRDRAKIRAHSYPHSSERLNFQRVITLVFQTLAAPFRLVHPTASRSACQELSFLLSESGVAWQPRRLPFSSVNLTPSERTCQGLFFCHPNQHDFVEQFLADYFQGFRQHWQTARAC